ncbi:TPA: hypothetical protein ACXNC8_003142 [Stenotrophomonas maltophilia]
MPLPPSRLSALIAIATTLLALTGCKERTYPTYRENPTPKSAIPIRIKVTDAPVDVPVPSVFAQFEIDPLCLPPTKRFTGAQLAPRTHKVRYPAKRISDTQFISTVFEDAMEIADYHGRGACTWTMSFIEASFPFVIDDRRIGVSAATTRDELASLTTETIRVRKVLSPLHPDQLPAWAGTWNSTAFKNRSDLNPADFFTIEISVETGGSNQ